MTRTIKRVLYVLAVVAVVLGIYGFGSRLLFGERDVNYGSYVNWGLWVAMYLFFAGLAAGSFMLATLDYVFDVPLFRGTGRYALWATIVTLPAALALIGLDLGHMERIWKVYLQPNFSSLLAQLVWSYSMFFLIAIVSLVLAIRGQRRGRGPVRREPRAGGLPKRDAAGPVPGPQPGVRGRPAARDRGLLRHRPGTRATWPAAPRPRARARGAAVREVVLPVGRLQPG